MKNANGFGSVYKMTGRRRRPWRAVVTVGRSPDGHQIRKSIGYFENKKDAMTALGVYNAAPYSLERLTFEDIYDRWKEERFAEVGSSSVRAYKMAFGYAASLHKKKFSQLRTIDLENCIRNAEVSPNVQASIKLLFSQLYKYALRYDLVQRNFAAEVRIEPIKETEKRRPFTDEEILLLWEYAKDKHPRIGADECVRLVLVGIYSGWRPSELCTYELDGGLMVGGVKTAAGKGRVVPVHPLIKDFVDREPLNYPKYSRWFEDLMKELGWSHTPHDTRRTFASLAASWKMDENVRKLIMGHKNADLTERVYTTHTVEELTREISKLGQIRASG